VPNPLSISLAGLRRDDAAAPWTGGARNAIQWGGTLGIRGVQLDATAPGMRARELDRSGRRDVAALLRRMELELTGLDLWLPGEHLLDPAHVDRAAAAVVGAIGLAAEIAPLAGAGGRLVSLTLPPKVGPDVLAQIVGEAARQGVRLADHAWPPRAVEGVGAATVGIGLDPAAVALAGEAIGDAAARMAERVVSARLCDLSSAGRVLPGSADGRLDVLAYRVALSLAPGVVPVVVDVRGLSEQDEGARRMIADWKGE